MKHLILAAALAATGGVASAQEITREEIRRTAVPGSDTLEVVVNRLIVPPGARLPLHTHPGDEHAVVITDATAETPGGDTVKFAIGTPLYFPAGQVHGGLTNTGEADMMAITTTVVPKGEPFTVLAE